MKPARKGLVLAMTVVAGCAATTPAPPPEPAQAPSREAAPPMVTESDAGADVRAREPTVAPAVTDAAVRAAVLDDVDGASKAQSAPVRKDRAARAAACRARGGSLEMVGGLAPAEECVFPFPDAGKACHDKADCRGDCLLVNSVPVAGGSVRLEGKCSRLETTFGCHARIGHTPGRSGVVAADKVPPTMCVD